MGCGPYVPKNVDVDNAKNPEELSKALEEYCSILDKEIKEIKDKKFVGKNICFPHLQSLNEGDLEKRVPYLEKFKNSFKELAKAIKLCNANTPLDNIKSDIQNQMFHYTHIYDDNLSFKENEFEALNHIETYVPVNQKNNFNKIKEGLVNNKK